MKSQNDQILAYLKSGKSITPIDALNEFGCFRLAARIYELRASGHRIEKEMEGEEKRYARYYMKG